MPQTWTARGQRVAAAALLIASLAAWPLEARAEFGVDSEAGRRISPPAAAPSGDLCGDRSETRGGAIWRSLLFPGLGQHYRDQHGKGWLFTLAAAGSGAVIYASERAREDAAGECEEAREAYSGAITQAEMDAAYAVMEDRWREADDKRKARDIGWVALAGVWALGLVDAALGWPAAEAGATVMPGVLADGTPVVVLGFRR